MLINFSNSLLNSGATGVKLCRNDMLAKLISLIFLIVPLILFVGCSGANKSPSTINSALPTVGGNTLSNSTGTMPTPYFVSHGSASTSQEVTPTPDDIHKRTLEMGREFTERSYENVLEGHQRTVLSVDFSPDGKLAVTGSDDATVRLWDVAKSQEIASLIGHKTSVPTVVFSPDGKTIASGSLDGTLRLWDIKTRKEIARIFPWGKNNRKEINSICYSADGKQIIVAGNDPDILVVRVSDRQTISRYLGHKGAVNFVKLSRDGTRLISASQDKTARIWEATNKSKVFGNSDWAFSSVDISPDNKILVAGNRGNEILMWDTQTGKLLAKLIGHRHGIESVVFSLDGKYLVTASLDRTIRIWDVKSRSFVGFFLWHIFDVRFVKFSPNGKILASTSNDLCVKLWDFEKELKSAPKVLPPNFYTEFPGKHKLLEVIKTPEGGATFVVYTPDGKFLAVGNDVSEIFIRDIKAKKWVATLKGHKDEITYLAISPNGKTLASASRDGTIGIWDMNRKALIKFLKGHKGEVRAVAFSPDGNYLLSGSADKTVKLWEAKNYTLLRTFEKHTSPVTSVAFAPDSVNFASAGHNDYIYFWNINQKDPTGEIVQYKTFGMDLDYSSDGKKLASGAGSCVIEIYDVATRKRDKKILSYKWRVTSVRFSPDGKLLASGSVDKNVTLWDTTTGYYYDVLSGHTSEVYSICFSPDGKNIASSSDDETVRIWEIR